MWGLHSGAARQPRRTRPAEISSSDLATVFHFARHRRKSLDLVRIVMILCTSLLLALVGTSSAFVSQATTRARSECTSLQANIAVFGASGLTASECVYQALKDGDNVVGLTRNPSNLKVPKGSGGADAEQALVDEKLTVIGGDVTKMSDVEKGESAAVAKVTLSSIIPSVLRTAHVNISTRTSSSSVRKRY